MAQDYKAIADQIHQIINSGDQSPEARQKVTDLQAEFNGRKAQADREAADAQKVSDQNAQYNKYYDDAATRGIDQFRKALVPQRSNLVAEEAALGRLDSPVARASLNRFDDQANNGISSMLAQLSGQQAQGYQGNQQFNDTMGFNQQKLNTQMDQFNRQLAQDKDLAISGMRNKLDVAQETKPGWWEKMLPETKMNFNFGK